MAAEDPEDSWPLLLGEIRGRLRERANRTASRATLIAVGLAFGYEPAEIRAIHGLTPQEYSEAARWVREELDAIRDRPAV